MKSMSLLLCIFSFSAASDNLPDYYAIFCSLCTNIDSYDHEIDFEKLANAPFTREQSGIINKLIAFEQGLIPDTPEASVIVPLVIGRGTTSAGLVVPGMDSFLIRRFAGFHDISRAIHHINLMQLYRSRLHRIGIETTDTQLIALESSGGYGIVYVLQPFLKHNQLAKNLFWHGSEDLRKALLGRLYQYTSRIITHNLSYSHNQTSIDAAYTNWEVYDFDGKHFKLRLNDLAQPLFKIDGKSVYDGFDQAFTILSPINWLVVSRQIKKEFDAFFQPQRLVIQSLAGLERPVDLPPWTKIYNWWFSIPAPLEHPDWAIEQANDVLRQFELHPLNPEKVILLFNDTFYTLHCLYYFRDITMIIRKWLGLSSNIYIFSSKAPSDSLPPNHNEGFFKCLLFILLRIVSSVDYY